MDAKGQAAIEILKRLRGEGFQAYLVGGCVRDLVMGFIPKDYDISTDAIAAGIARVRGVPGRLEAVANEAGVLCVVDYSHTPDALERALDGLRPLAKGRLICVFGCGGDRDPQ